MLFCGLSPLRNNLEGDIDASPGHLILVLQDIIKHSLLVGKIIVFVGLCHQSVD